MVHTVKSETVSKLQNKLVAATNGDNILSMYRYKAEYNRVTTFGSTYF